MPHLRQAMAHKRASIVLAANGRIMTVGVTAELTQLRIRIIPPPIGNDRFREDVKSPNKTVISDCGRSAS
jgi:hypothetical protein